MASHRFCCWRFEHYREPLDVRTSTLFQYTTIPRQALASISLQIVRRRWRRNAHLTCCISVRKATVWSAIVYNHCLFLKQKSAFSLLNLLFHNKYTKIVWNSCFNDLDFFHFQPIFLQCSTIEYCFEYHNFMETSLTKKWYRYRFGLLL